MVNNLMKRKHRSIRKVLNNKGSGAIIWFMISLVFFVGIQPLIVDFGEMLYMQAKVKNSLNKAVKAASLAVKDGEELANGNFIIDETKALEYYNRYLALNLGLNETSLNPLASGSLLSEAPIIQEFEVKNTTPCTYTSSFIGHTYEIKKPSVISSIEFTYNGVYLRKTFNVGKLSSSQLNSIYD